MLSIGRFLQVAVLGSLCLSPPPAHAETVDPAKWVLLPGDPDIPPNYVLSSQSSDGGFSLTIRSYYEPDRYIMTTITPEASNDAALTAFNQVSARYPALNLVLGQLGKDYQNNGTAGLGDASTVLQSKDRLAVIWVKKAYLLEVDDTTGQGAGLAQVRARDVEAKLEAQLGA